MALSADSNHNQCYEFSQMINHDEIVLFDDPVMVFQEENDDDDCKIVLEGCSNTHTNKGFKLSPPLYKGSFFENKRHRRQNGICVDEDNQVKEGLAMLEILHSTSSFCVPEDQPSYIDISKINDLLDSDKEESPIIISDDDDVIFVDSYTENQFEKRESKRFSAEFSTGRADGSKIRRNPVRTARNKSKDLSKDILFEEDFAFLDTSDEDIDEKENQVRDPKSTLQVDQYKEWPINVHERPEYNEETKRVESFDYTIREIRKHNHVSKKPRLETVIVKKSKKKYTSRKRNNRVSVEQKVPLESVKTTIDETTILLKEFFERSKESQNLLNRDSAKFSLNDKLEVLKNQVTLYAVVNDIDLNEVLTDIFTEETTSETEEL